MQKLNIQRLLENDIRSCVHTDLIDVLVTVLSTQPILEMGMAPWHTPCGHHSDLSLNF